MVALLVGIGIGTVAWYGVVLKRFLCNWVRDVNNAVKLCGNSVSIHLRLDILNERMDDLDRKIKTIMTRRNK